MEKKITVNDVEKWVGDDNLLEIITAIANGDYTPAQLKTDITEYLDK